MMKWLWRFTTDKNSMWKDVTIIKYGAEGNWAIDRVNISYGG